MPVFINLPVSDVERSAAFCTALGWSINPLFSDENATCVIVDEHTYLMMLRRDFYATFIGDKVVADPAATSGALIAFDLPSREAVDAFMDRAESAGAKVGTTQDLGFMYQRQFDDPDGNHFEPFWMDPAAAESGPPA